MTGTLARPATTVRTAFQLNIVAVGVSGTDVGAHCRVARDQCFWRTRSWTNDVDLIQKVTAFTARC